MTRSLLPLALLGLLLLALPGASAEANESDEADRPDDAAWVDDCPPDTMCAMGGAPENETGDGPTHTGDCGGEACAYDGAPGTLGPDGCIDCMQPPVEADAGADPAAKTVPGLPVATALGILALAALGIALLRR